MAVCIYCKRELVESEFNKEHVLPRAFGTFENNLTLIEIVCKECNSFFSTALELYLARDSIEAVQRLERGLKPLELENELRQQRVGYSIDVEGPWEGARLQLGVEDNELVVGLVPQVGFHKKAGGERRLFITEEELATSDAWRDRVDPAGNLLVAAPSIEVRDRIIAKLKEKGISFTATMEMPAPPTESGRVLTETAVKIDSVIRRAVAKIAFNYAAFTAGPVLLLDPAFDVTRRFIRFGDKPDYPLVVVDDVPILYDDMRTARQTSGHLITLEWAPCGRDAVSQVALFNWIRYRISVGRHFTGIWREIRSGHHFDHESRQIHQLVGLPKFLL